MKTYYYSIYYYKNIYRICTKEVEKEKEELKYLREVNKQIKPRGNPETVLQPDFIKRSSVPEHQNLKPETQKPMPN